MNRRQLRALIQESMRIGYELDGPRSEFYDDGLPEDDEPGLRFMSPRGRAPMSYAVDDSQDAMDMDLQLVPSDDYEGMGRLMRSQGREMPHHHDDDYSDLGDLDIMGFEDDMLDDDMMMERNQIRKMIADGNKVDMVLLDYIDCVLPDRQHSDEWKSEGSVMRGFESMCHELDLVGWTATQGNRSSISSDVVTTDQMGGSIKKAQVGHVIISVAKSLQQKEMKLATIAITKSRIGDDGVVFENCKFDNGMLEIDTESSVTFLGLEEQTEERNRQRIKDLLDKRKQKEQTQN